MHTANRTAEKLIKGCIVLVAFLALMMAAPLTASAGQGTYWSEDGIKYSYDTDEDTAYVTSFDSASLPANVEIPATIEIEGVEYKVTGVATGAFIKSSSLEKITFLGDVESIGKDAFLSCGKLQSVRFAGDAGSIGMTAFASCYKLESVEFSGDVGDIVTNAFAGSSLKSVVFAGEVKSIGDYAFSGCSDLADIYFAGTEAKWRAVPLGRSWCNKDDLKVHCKYDVVANPVDGGTVEGDAVIVYGSDGLPKAIEPITATLKAVPNQGYAFVEWTGPNVVTFADAKAPETTLTSTVASATATANFELVKYDVTVVDGTTADSPAAEGATVTIKADDPAPGTFFKWWESNQLNDSDFADVTAAQTTFTMPAKAVKVTAVYDKVLIGPADGDIGDSIPDQTYTGSAIEPELKVYLDGVDELLDKNDYDVVYTDNVNAGTATATVTLKAPGSGAAASCSILKSARLR